MLRRRWQWVATLVLLAAPCRAAPQDAAAAEALFHAGRVAAEHGDVRTACQRFEESYRLDPALGALLNLARCEEELGQLARSWESYRHLLEALDPNDERLAAVRERLAALEPRVPHLVLVLAPGVPTDVSVHRDGVLMTTASLGLPLPVDPGAHTLVVTATGRVPRSYVVGLVEGETRNLTLEIGGSASPAHPAAMEAPATAARSSGPLRVAAIAALGVSGASLLATGLLTYAYAHARGTIDAHCPSPRTCDDPGIRAVGAAELLQTAAAIAGVTTAVSLGTGLTLLWLPPSSASPSPTAAMPSGVSWSGRF